MFRVPLAFAHRGFREELPESAWQAGDDELVQHSDGAICLIGDVWRLRQLVARGDPKTWKEQKRVGPASEIRQTEMQRLSTSTVSQ